ncbi:MAG: hypothetical protein NVSMB60_26180 [Mycobacterium sp.]
MPVVVAPPSVGTQNEGFVLGGLDLNSGPAPAGNYTLEEAVFTPPQKRMEWAQGADGDGSLLVRTPLFDNRTITARVRIEPQPTMDGALALVGSIVDKLQEAEQNPGGLTLVWTPAQGSKSITFYVLSGEVKDMPISVTGDIAGWFVKAPVVTLVLICKPFGYGAEVAGPSASSTTPIVTLAVPNVPGDVPAEGRLVVTDAAAQSRRFVEWGLEQRYSDATQALLIDSADLVTTGFAGTQTTLAGAYRRAGATSDVVQASVYGVTALAGTGNLGHVGTFRVRARVNTAGGLDSFRITYQDGDGALRSNPWALPPAQGFAEVDLGVVTITPAASGTQKWSARIEATPNVGGNVMSVDYLVLIPVAEGYGKARAGTNAAKGSTVAADPFNAAGTAALGTTTAPSGGAWATSGSATDFAYNGSNLLQRSTINDAAPRFGIIGTAVTDTSAQVYISSSLQHSGVVCRWIDISNYVVAEMSQARIGSQNYTVLQVSQVVAGVKTTIGQNFANLVAGTMVLSVYAGGSFVATFAGVTASGSSTTLASGGALASGKAGIYDFNATGSAVTRTFQSFIASTLPPEPIVAYASRTVEFRPDSTVRPDSTGTYYGSVPVYRGSRFLIPQAGTANRTARILVKADRNDVDTSPSTTPGDNLTVQAFYTPRYSVIPR